MEPENIQEQWKFVQKLKISLKSENSLYYNISERIQLKYSRKCLKNKHFCKKYDFCKHIRKNEHKCQNFLYLRTGMTKSNFRTNFCLVSWFNYLCCVTISYYLIGKYIIPLLHSLSQRISSGKEKKDKISPYCI
jgi:hypothetical protein